MPKARRGNKPPKDLSAPKRPPTAYFIFAGSRRSDLKKTYPDKKVTEISKLIAKEWNDLDATQKETFTNEFKKLQKTYKENLEKYKTTDDYKQYQKRLQNWKKEQQSDDDSDDGSSKRRKVPRAKKPKDPHAPKRPQASYFLFQNKRRTEIRSNDPNMKMKDIAKKIGAEWGQMSTDEKEEFETKAKELKIQYEKDIEEYKKSDNYSNFQNTLKQWEKQQRQAKSVKKNKIKQQQQHQQQSDEEDSDEDEDSDDEEDDDSDDDDDDDDSGVNNSNNNNHHHNNNSNNMNNSNNNDEDSSSDEEDDDDDDEDDSDEESDDD